MLLRLVTSYCRGGALLLPGERLEVEPAEAELLVEEGIAVPVTDREKTAAETR